MFPSCPAREILKHFQTKCWSFEEDELCSQTDFSQDGCLELMDPGLLLGDEPECKKTFLATLGTVLHHPCSCNGVHNDHVLTCSRIHDVLHNRSLFSEYGLNLGNANKQKSVHPMGRDTFGAVYCVSCVFQWCLGRAAVDLWNLRKWTNLDKISRGPTVNFQVGLV